MVSAHLYVGGSWNSWVARCDWQLGVVGAQVCPWQLDVIGTHEFGDASFMWLVPACVAMAVGCGLWPTRLAVAVECGWRRCVWR